MKGSCASGSFASGASTSALSFAPSPGASSAGESSRSSSEASATGVAASSNESSGGSSTLGAAFSGSCSSGATSSKSSSYSSGAALSPGSSASGGCSPISGASPVGSGAGGSGTKSSSITMPSSSPCPTKAASSNNSAPSIAPSPISEGSDSRSVGFVTSFDGWGVPFLTAILRVGVNFSSSISMSRLSAAGGVRPPRELPLGESRCAGALEDEDDSAPERPPPEPAPVNRTDGFAADRAAAGSEALASVPAPASRGFGALACCFAAPRRRSKAFDSPGGPFQPFAGEPRFVAPCFAPGGSEGSTVDTVVSDGRLTEPDVFFIFSAASRRNCVDRIWASLRTWSSRLMRSKSSS
mmetsp:Transcript_75953/g.220576  ORF Transcript_75953/g.220576 Transcript_75953/m.220576 type:complete len:354 (-) Transcript_75953:575-1636(-)